MLELEHRFRVVDVHVRLNADPGSSTGRSITPDTLEREMHQAGVVRSVVFPGQRSNTDYLRANNAVARLSVDRPFVAFARINGTRDPGRGATSQLRNLTTSREEYHTTPEDIEQYAYDDRFHGFKLDPVSDGIPDGEVLAVLDDVGLPVLVHGDERVPPETIADELLDHSFPVILAHFGGHPLNQDAMDRGIDLLDEYDDYYLDTSYVRYRDQLERALLEYPDRILFGSGGPETHPNVAVMEILTLDVSEDKLHRVFDTNPSRVIDALASDHE
ncbi:amidohydrolase family protein [Natranaeroarchaeum sulfidigenes]|uniref:Putative metal-dependent hydrolase of the TIM-barrel fold n=1 Tax=Natranaeroarchaeum sulfidigenes TaxID=2784880 RepID=A0A897MNQ0_9EURY|nr:amidohydrolase family protein [Natranaeroarchaeum sulfidigenes]QSG03800.1 putative metal-dependent hydrolase of the TIM-barrel fold [Natranaeroarchaeum sulfidigenes]